MSEGHWMESTMSEHQSDSPAGKVMSEAIELAIAEESPYPEQSLFLDAHTPHADREMEWAARDGYSVVLVSPNGEVQIIAPEEIVGSRSEGGAQPTVNPAPQ